MIEVTIKNVGELLDLLKENVKDNHLFFRGESKDYGDNKLTPTLYRKKIYMDRNDDNYHDNLLIKEYKIASRDLYDHVEEISQRNLDNFMAFCQHHSLPTPLLDVSESPLVGLFFATIDHKEDDGKLYIFDRNKSIRISSSILKYNSNLDEIDIHFNDCYKQYINYFKNYCEETSEQNKYFETTLFTKLLNGLKEHIVQHDLLIDSTNSLKELMYAKNLDDVKNLIFEKEVEKNDIHENFIKFLSTLDIKAFVNNSKRIDNEFIGKNGHLESLNTGYYIYGFIMWLSCINNPNVSHDLNAKNLDFYVKPTFIHERIKSQKGLFLINLPYGNSELENNVSHPKPIISITIPSYYKDNMMRELDFLGINAGNLYLDVDHIAEYISKNHFKS